MFDALSERRLAAIVLCDVVGYSRLMGIDEVGTMTALKAHRNELMLPALAAYHGRMVGVTGDANLMEFGSAVDAVSCAVAIQRTMIARNRDVPEEGRLRFRFGINLGDIVIDGEGIYGDGVNVAARLEALCEPGGVCLSRSIEEQIRGKLAFPFVDGGEQQLKNISHPIRIFRLPAEFLATLPEIALPAGRKKSTPPQAPIVAGSVLNDTYQVDDLIGTGGMGEIFRGHEIHSGGLVAIKVIRPDMMNNETALALFQKEARVLKDIHHDAIVRYYIFSFDPGSRRHYLTMEFVDGVALVNLVKQGPLPIEAVTALRRRVASGLQVAHDGGIVHRDVSSDNIIVPHGDLARAKIIDFGIARATDIGGGTIIGGGFAGKYNYVSPEQLGLGGGEVTPRSDIYSLGLVLAEACLGAPIDMGGTHEQVIEKRRVVPDLRDIDPSLRPLLEWMLQPDPDRRPRSMAEVAAWSGETRPEHERLVAEEQGPAPGWATPSPPPAGRVRLAPKPVLAPKAARPVEHWIIGGALGVAVLFGAGLVAYDKLAPDKPRPVPPKEGPKPSPPDTPPSPPPTESAGQNDTPPVTPVPPSPPPVGVDQIVDYIRAYDGGGCFFAQPVNVTTTSAAIDAFALSKDFVPTLLRSFNESIGFQPDVVGARVWSRQCPALDFMRRVRTDETAPTLFLKSLKIGRDQSLAGEIHARPQQSIALLQVRDDGTVVNISKDLKPNGTAQTFDLHMTHAAGPGPFPQLLIAVASPRPLASLSKGDMAAAQVFSAAVQEAVGHGDTLSASVKAFVYGE